MSDLVLPAFEMDCRDWMVVSPSEAGLPEDVAGAPLLAVLSTVLIDSVASDVIEATGALTVGIIDEDEDLDVRPLRPGSTAQELMDEEPMPGTRRFVMPAPGQPGQQLALLAEFVVQRDYDAELEDRVEKLMASFRWQLDSDAA